MGYLSTFWSSMLHGISNTTMKRNMSWFPRLIVAWLTPISVAKPAVRALAKFMRSSWKTSRPRNRSGRTVVSTLVCIRLVQMIMIHGVRTYVEPRPLPSGSMSDCLASLERLPIRGHSGFSP